MVRLPHPKSGLISKISRQQAAGPQGCSGEISYPGASISLKQLKRLKPSDAQEAVVDYLNGASVQVIANRLEISRQTVSMMLTDHQVERRRGALGERRIEELIAQRQRGLTLQQIADQFGVSLSTIKRRVREQSSQK